MLKKTITFHDFNGVETTQDFYFNLTKAEAVLLEVARDGGTTLSETLQELIDSRSNKTLVREFTEIIRLSYGERSIDGKRFEKGENQELAKRFESTGAYHVLLLELISDAGAAVHFINGVVPDELASDPDQLIAQTQSQKTARQRSEERLTDYQKKQKKQPSTSQIVPDLPTSTGPIVQGEVVDTPSAPVQAEPLPEPAPTPAANTEATFINTAPEIVVNPAPQQDPTTRRQAIAADLQQQYTQQGR